MEEFLNDYVQMIAEAQDIELNNKQLQVIVNRIREDESLWDTFDSYIIDEIENEVN